MLLQATKFTRFVVAGISMLSILISTSTVFGHHLWIIQDGDGYMVARGALPDRLDPYAPTAVKMIKAVDREGGEIPITRIAEKEKALFRAERPPCLAAVRCEWGGRVETTRGKKLMTRQKAEKQGFKVLKAFTSTQTSKTMFAETTAISNPLGLVFEVVPLKSPYRLGPDEPLAVKLLFDGAPLKHAVVSLNDQTRTETDAQGIARFAVKQSGLQLIAAKHIVPVKDNSEIDHLKFMTFFIFEAK
jgi:nickel transport protein